MKKLIYKFYKILFPRRVELQKRVKTGISLFFDHNSVQISSWMLHSVSAKERQGKVIITISLERVGLMLGKGGQTIDKLKQTLSDWLDKPVEIKIKEYCVLIEPSERR